MTYWYEDAFFYHIYPLGLCGAPIKNELGKPTVYRLEKLMTWLDHIQSLGINAIYLGPVFQSSTHGYDTMDYYRVDRRLGDNDTLAELAENIHLRGMRLVLDGVFNHVGRDFWAFKDVLSKGEESDYKEWFKNLCFGERSPMGDAFQYEGWQGHYDLVKLNLSNPDVRKHLFDAVGKWMREFKIDGLRLDAADCIDFEFLKALHKFTKSQKPDFWLMGEVVHGNYCQWVNPEMLDSVTNYECYKGMYSSLNETNYFEIAYSLNRQFGKGGIYQDFHLYNFVDNHDVNRVANKLENMAHLYPLYLLLFTMPGIPSLYYGSEYGVKGEKSEWSDEPLRPDLNLSHLRQGENHTDLKKEIQRLAALRKSVASLRVGSYKEIFVNHQQFAFMRQDRDTSIVVVLNSASQPIEVHLKLPWEMGMLTDLLDDGVTFKINEGQSKISLMPSWGRVLSFSC